MEKLYALKNIEYAEDHALFRLNPKIYPLNVVYSASYIMIDKAFILLDGDPANEIVVELRRRRPDQDIKKLLEDFNQELLNYAVYNAQSEKNKRLSEILMEKIMLANTPETFMELYKGMKKSQEDRDQH